MGESSAKQQDDPVFVAFRRKLEDAVLVAINSGQRVSARLGVFWCPLGCHPDAHNRRPYGSARDVWGLRLVCIRRFIEGFEGRGKPVGPYGRLGRLYAARFP